MKQFNQTIIVTNEQTAQSMGSGTLPVLATPALVALMENTAMLLLSDLPDGETSVGILINVEHLKASIVGEKIECTATLTNTEGRKYSFLIEAKDSNENIIGRATHDRFVVNTQRFMGKLT